MPRVKNPVLPTLKCMKKSPFFRRLPLHFAFFRFLWSAWPTPILSLYDCYLHLFPFFTSFHSWPCRWSSLFAQGCEPNSLCHQFLPEMIYQDKWYKLVWKKALNHLFFIKEKQMLLTTLWSGTILFPSQLKKLIMVILLSALISFLVPLRKVSPSSTFRNREHLM